MLLSPLVHFFVIGAVIFAVYGVIDDSPPPMDRDEIVLTADEAERISAGFSATWGRQPTSEELQNLFHGWALEEAYVREALRLGLDRDDRIIRQRLVMKMQYLAESSAAATGADDAALQAFLDANRGRFDLPAQIAFEQVLLPTTTQPEQIPTALAALQNGTDPLSVGRAGLLPTSIAMTPAPAIDRQFGEGFYTQLADLRVDHWQGPVKSAYGLHMIRVISRVPAQSPELAEIRQRVEAEWRAAQAREMREAFGEALLGRYSVTFPNIAKAGTQ